MPSQRPYFLSSFIAAFRQQPPSIQPSSQQPSKHTSQASSSATSSTANHATASPSSSRTISAAAAASQQHHHHHQSSSMAVHSPRSGAVPIPNATSASGTGRRRGSDSSSEGFRDAIGADKWYIGGRTATGEEKFFKLGVVRRVKSNDGLSLDRLSL